MEYEQMTLNDWMEMKKKLNVELLGVKRSFVRIGYLLRKIEEEKLYEQDGYKSVAEFAKAEYGLEGSTVSRFIGINREYSIDGYSEHLMPEYEDFGRSQLEEMMKLPLEDRKMIMPETSRAGIRELKAFNKEQPEEGAADSLHELVKAFFKERKNVLNEAYKNPESVKAIKEAVNPSGNTSFRKGTYFMLMYESKISIKHFGGTPQEVSWEAFADIMHDLFGTEAGSRIWEEYFGEPQEDVTAQMETTSLEDDVARKAEEPSKEKVEKAKEEYVEHLNEEKEQEREEKDDEKPRGKDTSGTERDAKRDEGVGRTGEKVSIEQDKRRNGEENRSEEIAPAQKTAEILGETGDESTKKEEEKIEETQKSEEEKKQSGQQEVIEKPFGSRKAYMDTLTEYEMALYLAKEYEEHRLLVSNLAFPEKLEKWLKEKVKDLGRAMED